MTIRSDRWIRRMAKEQGLIEPFEEQQVRYVSGERVISYGTSSYGYDVRCADEFKIFTNINTTIVDPKEFDERSFVDYQGDVCVIPPNSFALARTVEYFRIPRRVLVLCLGKSTYARCFRGDQRVALVDGTSVSLEDMARRADQGEDFWGYSLGEFGKIIVSKLEAPRFIGRDSLMEIVLDSGEVIRCTPDHEFIRRDGTRVAAGNLRPDDSLMPLYRDVFRGYEMVYQPINSQYHPTHRLADEWNLRHCVYPDGEDFDAEEHSAAIQAALRRRAEDPEWRRHFASVQRERAEGFWSDPKYADTRDALLAARRNPSEATREAHRQATLRRYADPAERERQSRLTGSIRGAARLLSCDRSVFRRFPEVIAAFRGKPGLNHKVASVRELPGDHDVYCLTVPEAGNFALQAGVFTSNCGIIVNVTPLEPEWEGHITLEFSNTTPLPARIYANEGVAQVVFLESDEECETSYRDRGGKYQGQRGVTLPKT